MPSNPPPAPGCPPEPGWAGPELGITTFKLVARKSFCLLEPVGEPPLDKPGEGVWEGGKVGELAGWYPFWWGTSNIPLPVECGRTGAGLPAPTDKWPGLTPWSCWLELSLYWLSLTGTLTGMDAKPVPDKRFPLTWFRCIMIWNSSSILLYLASVRGVKFVSRSLSESAQSGLPAEPPLFSFLLRA